MRAEDPAATVEDQDFPVEPRAVVVASPVPAYRHRWASALRGRAQVCEVADRGLQEEMLRLRPAVVFIDLALPALGGIAGVPAIQRLHPPVRIVLLARAPTERQALLALAAGARGYCSTDIDPGLIRRAVEVVERGEIWIGRQVIPLLLRRLTALADVEERDPSGPLPYLGARERQIALLVGAGANNRDIAAKLAITEATVKAHLTSVFRKLKVPNRLRLALVVTQHAGRDHQAPRHRRAPGLRPVAAPAAEG